MNTEDTVLYKKGFQDGLKKYYDEKYNTDFDLDKYLEEGAYNDSLKYDLGYAEAEKRKEKWDIKQPMLWDKE